MFKKALHISLFTIFLGLTHLAFAHSGRTNSSGCHHDRKNGGYHCHKADLTSEKQAQERNPASIKTSKPKLDKGRKQVRNDL